MVRTFIGSASRIGSGIVALAVACVAVPSTAHAATGACTLTVPSQVTIARPTTYITPKISGGCALPGGEGAWNRYSPSGTLLDSYDSVEPDLQTWIVNDTDQLGPSTWRPALAYGPSGNLTQNSPTSELRLGSAETIAATRSGTQVRLTGTVSYYSPSKHAFVRWAGAKTVVQYFDKSTNTWHNLKELISTSSGTVSWSLSTSVVRSYRLANYSTPSVWSAASAPITK